MAKHRTRMKDLQPFKRWEDAADFADELVNEIVTDPPEEGREGIFIGVRLMNFVFRLRLTAEQERRKNK